MRRFIMNFRILALFSVVFLECGNGVDFVDFKGNRSSLRTRERLERLSHNSFGEKETQYQEVYKVCSVVQDEGNIEVFCEYYSRILGLASDDEKKRHLDSWLCSTLFDFNEKGGTDDFYLAFLDSFLKTAPFLEEPFESSIRIFSAILLFLHNEKFKLILPSIPKLIEWIYKSDFIEGKEQNVKCFLQRCYEHAVSYIEGYNPYLFSILMQTTFPYIKSTEQINAVFDFLSEVYGVLQSDSETCRILEYIPYAVKNNIARTGSVFKALEEVVSLLKNDQETLFYIIEACDGVCLPDSSSQLLIVLLSKLDDFFFIAKDFFKFVDKRMKEIEGFAPLFDDFVTSIFNSLITRLKDFHDKKDTYDAVIIASNLLKDAVVPDKVDADEITDAFKEIFNVISNIDLQQNRLSEDVDRCLAELLEHIMTEGRSKIPLSAYEVLGMILITICGHPQLFIQSLDVLTNNYEWLTPYPFKLKSLFIEPIGYQMLYLHQMLSIGLAH